MTAHQSSASNIIPLFPPTINIGARSPSDTMAFAEVSQILHLNYSRTATIIHRLRSLYHHCNMPLPINHRFLKGKPQTGASRICKKSLWSRREFLNWMDSQRGGTTGAIENSINRLAQNAHLVSSR